MPKKIENVERVQVSGSYLEQKLVQTLHTLPDEGDAALFRVEVVGRVTYDVNTGPVLYVLDFGALHDETGIALTYVLGPAVSYGNIGGNFEVYFDDDDVILNFTFTNENYSGDLDAVVRWTVEPLPPPL